MIAALFVQENGCYYGIDGVDPWPEARDARKYNGPHPVVAHPPCQLWGRFARVNYKRWGGEHNKPGNDGGCFASALISVRTFCGVLEHPADTYAWQAHGLPKPKGIGWQYVEGFSGLEAEWVCEVWQSAYGHKARKRTWLFYRGQRAPFDLRWDRSPGTHWIGHYDRKIPGNHKPGLTAKEASATPIEFRDALLRLARSSASVL
jgi:hypothetical protein